MNRSGHVLKWLGVAACLFQAAGASADSSVLGRVESRGVLRASYTRSDPPFSYIDAKGQPIGYSVDLTKSIAAAIDERLKQDGHKPDLKLKLIEVEGQDRFRFVRDGVVDLECTVSTVTPERGRLVAFSTPFFIAGVRLLTQKATGIQSFDGLKGKHVVVVAGSTSESLLHDPKRNKALGAKVVLAPDVDHAFRMVETGRAAALVLDDVLLAGLRARATKPDSLIIVGEPLSEEPYACAMQKGDRQLKELVDGALDTMRKNGRLRALYTKWFEHPIGPHDHTMDSPLSAANEALLGGKTAPK